MAESRSVSQLKSFADQAVRGRYLPLLSAALGACALSIRVGLLQATLLAASSCALLVVMVIAVRWCASEDSHGANWAETSSRTSGERLPGVMAGIARTVGRSGADYF